MAAHAPAAPTSQLAWGLAVALAVATTLAYAPAITAPFQFDDIESIATNPSIRRLWPLSTPLHPPRGVAVSGRPVVNYSLALNYATNAVLGIDQSPDPGGPYKTVVFHVTNLVLHLACGMLLFGIIRRTLRSPRLDARWASVADTVAWTATALWLLHPIQAEAVNYLIQRTELMVGLFYLGTVYAALRAWQAATPQARFRWYVTAFVACTLGMGSKEVMITAPLMVFLYDRAFHSPSWRVACGLDGGRRWFYVALLGTTSVVFWSVLAGARAETVGFRLGLPWYRYLYSQAWAITNYIRLTFVPTHLTPDYGVAPITGYRGIPGVVLLGGLGIATVVAWKRWLPLAFLGAWFFLILAPSSSVVPISTEIAAERRFYLPLIAIVLLVALGLTRLTKRMQSLAAADTPTWRRTVLRTSRLWLPLMLCGALTAATFQRSQVYSTPESFWRDVIAKAPDNPRGYNGLSAVLLEGDAPRLPEAEAVLRRAIAVDSTFLPAWPNLALVVAEQGRLPEARALMERVLRAHPDYARAVEVLGHVLLRMGEPATATKYLERAAQADPSDQTLTDLGTAYLALNRLDDAIPVFRRATAVNPGRADGLTMLGVALTGAGRAAEAVPFLEEAAGRDPTSGLAFAALSDAYAAAGKATEATAAAQVAERFMAEAARLQPDDPEVLTRLAVVRAMLGKRDAAEELLRQILATHPDFVPARRALSQLRRDSSP